MAASLLGLGLLLSATPAGAQSPYGGARPAAPVAAAPVAVEPAPQPLHMPKPVEVPAAAIGAPEPQPRTIEAPALHFTKDAAGKGDGSAVPSFQPDLMIQPASMQVEAAPRPAEQRLGADLVRPTTSATSATGEEGAYDIQLEPPGPQRVFRLESEVDLFRRIRQDSVNRPGVGFEFPIQPIISTEQFAGRQWAPSTEVVEPGYVCYGRLLFEDRNSERYGWDLGYIQPFVSLGVFYFDMVFSPYHRFEDIWRCGECNTGYCLPGDPIPYLIYPPRWSVTGALAEAATVLAIVSVFP